MKAHWGSIVCFFCISINIPGILLGHWQSWIAGLMCAALMLLCLHYEQETIKNKREIAEINEQIRKLDQ